MFEVNNSNKKPVFYDHSGGIDDAVSLILLLTMDNIRLLGVSVSEGNCLIEDAIENTLRIFSFFKRDDLKVAKSEAYAIHPFPEEWREHASFIKNLKRLNRREPNISQISALNGSDFLAQSILNEEKKTTVLLTGPATNLATAIEKYPELVQKIEKIVWMAGAITVSGNVMQPDHDGSAEWNIFWDSVSAKKLLHSDIPIVLFPLDVTRQVPVDERLLYKLNRHNQNKVTKLVTKIYRHAFDLSNYYMWHTLTALHIGHDDFAFLQKAKVDIEHRGTSQGNIYKSEIGVEIEYAFDIDEREFLYYFFNQMKDY